MADTYHTIGSTGIQKKLIELSDGTYADASYDGARALGTEVIAAGATSHLGKHAAPVNTETIYVRHKPEAGKDVEWRVKSDVVHTVQKFRARSIVDSMTITLNSIDDTDAATINGVTFAAEDTATDALRSAHKFYTGGADDTADAVELAAGINRGVAVTIGTVAVADTITIGNGSDAAKTFTAAAAADVPNGVFSQAGTPTQDAASLVLCINHKDTIKFTSDATSIAATNPATNNTTELYALADEVMEDFIVHIANTAFHTAATGTITHTNATSEATAIAEVNLLRTNLLAHLNSSTLHGTADATNYAVAAASVAATTAATATACVNILATAYLAHIALATPTAGDTITINNGLTSTTFTAHAATTTAATHTFSVAGTDSQNGDELVTCINDRATITVATCVANDTVTINGLTFSGKTSTAVARDRRFSVDTDDTATATSLTSLINDATYGVDGVTATSALGVITLIPDYGTTITMDSDFATITCKDAAGVEGITASNASGTVSLTRNSADYTVAVTSTGHVHNPITIAAARGIPGVLATSNAAEVDICPSWDSIDGDEFTVVPSANTITWVRYGIPGVTATSAGAVVTVVPKATNGATVLQSVTGTAAGDWAVAYTTLSNLIISAAATVDAAANSTTAGGDYIDTLNGYEYAYLGVTNKSGSGAMTCTVGATDH